MKNPTVSAGQKVTVKQVLGTVATDPTDKTTELQFQIWKNGAPVNPSSWIAR
jgi:murein hydrolase activator